MRQRNIFCESRDLYTQRRIRNVKILKRTEGNIFVIYLGNVIFCKTYKVTQVMRLGKVFNVCLQLDTNCDDK